MVAYSFQRRFREPILAGTKRQTIRSERKRHARPGEQVQLFTGMRTKQCQRIGFATCGSVAPISLEFSLRQVICHDACLHLPHELDDFAIHDGFQDWPDLCQFWTAQNAGVLPAAWSGVMISWDGFTTGVSR